MKNYELHTFYCMNCGREAIPIQRQISHKHEKHHRKVLYCPWCKQTVNHIECRTPAEVLEFKTNFEKGLYKNECQTSLNYSNSSNKIGVITC